MFGCDAPASAEIEDQRLSLSRLFIHPSLGCRRLLIHTTSTRSLLRFATIWEVVTTLSCLNTYHPLSRWMRWKGGWMINMDFGSASRKVRKRKGSRGSLFREKASRGNQFQHGALGSSTECGGRVELFKLFALSSIVRRCVCPYSEHLQLRTQLLARWMKLRTISSSS